MDDLFQKPDLTVIELPQLQPLLRLMGASRNRPQTSLFSTIPTEWKEHILARPLRAINARQRGVQVQQAMNVIKSIDQQSTLLERVGATLLLCSMVEGRVRALYRQRHAMLHGLPLPSAATEEQEYETARQSGRTLKHTRADTWELAKVGRLLHAYGDIDALTAAEIEEFTKYRNALVHDAMYRLDQFQIPFIHALMEFYEDLTLIRQRLRTRLQNEMIVFPHGQSVRISMEVRLAGISPHSFIPTEAFIARFGASTALKAPFVHDQPRLFVVTVQPGIAYARVSEMEQAYHPSWAKPEILVGQEFFVFSQRNFRGMTGYRFLDARQVTHVQIKGKDVIVSFGSK